MYSQLSQCCPDVPAGHLHCPVTLSQGAPVQLQGCTQPDPNLPSGQSAAGQMGNHLFFLSMAGQKSRYKSAVEGNVRSFSSYPGRSSLHDDPVGIFFGILQLHGRRKLLLDRHTSSHSLLHKYPGHILEAEQEEKIPPISWVATSQPSWSVK